MQMTDYQNEVWKLFQRLVSGTIGSRVSLALSPDKAFNHLSKCYRL